MISDQWVLGVGLVGAGVGLLGIRGVMSGLRLPVGWRFAFVDFGEHFVGYSEEFGRFNEFSVE